LHPTRHRFFKIDDRLEPPVSATFFVSSTSSPVIGDTREDLHQNEPACRTNSLSRGRRRGESHWIEAFGREREREKERGEGRRSAMGIYLDAKIQKFPIAQK